jgi:hypothetical protein
MLHVGSNRLGGLALGPPRPTPPLFPLIRAPSTIRSTLAIASPNTQSSLYTLVCISATTASRLSPCPPFARRLLPSWQDLRKYELEKEVEGLATLSRGYLATISALEAQLREEQAGKRML